MPEIQMPKLSDTMTEGTLVSWKKKKGDHVSAGEVLAEIETDKATMEWEATDDGVLNEIYVQEGGRVNVGDRIAFIGGEGRKPGKRARRKTKSPRRLKRRKPRLLPTKSRPRNQKNKNPRQKNPNRRASKHSPLARKIAEGKGIDLTASKHRSRRTHRGKRCRGCCLRNRRTPCRSGREKNQSPPPTIAAAKPPASASRHAQDHRRSARLEPRPVPHFYLNIEINADALMRVRAELKSAGEDDDATKITINDFILKGAVVAALREPKVNAAFDGDAIIHTATSTSRSRVASTKAWSRGHSRRANKSLREISAAVKDLPPRAQ